MYSTSHSKPITLLIVIVTSTSIVNEEHTENEYGNVDEVHGYKVHVIEGKASPTYYSQHQHHSIAHYNHTLSESDAFTQHNLNFS